MYRFASASLCIAIATAQPAADARIAPVPPNNHVVAACAAFASDGGSAAATVDAAALSVDITDPGGHMSHLAVPFDQTGMNARPQRFPGETTCRAYFDRESDLIAIGMDDGSFSAWVAVVDSKHSTRLGHWTVGPTAGILHPRLAGFLGKNVIIIGQPFTQTARRVQARGGSSLSLVFDPQGQQFQGEPVERTYASGTATRSTPTLGTTDCGSSAAAQSRGLFRISLTVRSTGSR